MTDCIIAAISKVTSEWIIAALAHVTIVVEAAEGVTLSAEGSSTKGVSFDLFEKKAWFV